MEGNSVDKKREERDGFKVRNRETLPETIERDVCAGGVKRSEERGRRQSRRGEGGEEKIGGQRSR